MLSSKGFVDQANGASDGEMEQARQMEHVMEMEQPLGNGAGHGNGAGSGKWSSLREMQQCNGGGQVKERGKTE